jgi:UDP-2,3-diacylglucosamine pyrophosphatase LpxH
MICNRIDADFRWVINGHSHRQMVRSFPGMTIINAGTLRPHSPCFLELDFEQGVVLVFEFAPDGSITPVPRRLALS